MEAIAINYKGGRTTQYTNKLVLKVSNISKKEDASSLINKTVYWVTPSGKKIQGKITKTHGNKGNVIARFEKGIPGQAIGTKLKIE